jgi:hypothetical protein
MAESICAPDAPPSEPSLATMAVAAGAAVLAGAMMGRKGLAGIVAGVAAFAGAKWYTGARSTAPEAPGEDTTAVVDLSPEVHPPTVECADWLDHDAVDFTHIVPDSAEAAEMLKEKTLPLLDDDGHPVEFIEVAAAFPEVPVALGYPAVPESEFPLGPIIWKPGRFPQSASAGTSETVWYGVQDVTPAELAQPPPPSALPSPASLEPFAPPMQAVIPEPAPPPIAAQRIVEETLAPAPLPPPPVAVSPPLPISVGLSAITHPKPASPPIAQNPFLAPVALRPEPVPAAFHAPPAPAAPSAIAPIPFSSGAFGSPAVSFVAAADAADAPVVTARPAAKSSLPQRRRPGELPKHMAPRVPEDDPDAPTTPHFDQTPPWRAGAHFVQGQVCVDTSAAPPQRHLERFAPVTVEPEGQRWPLLVLLCLIIAIGVAIAVDRWHDGALLHKVEALPLFQKSAEIEHLPVSPAPPTPAAATEPAKRGPWIEPAPAPEE